MKKREEGSFFNLWLDRPFGSDSTWGALFIIQSIKTMVAKVGPIPSQKIERLGKERLSGGSQPHSSNHFVLPLAFAFCAAPLLGDFGIPQLGFCTLVFNLIIGHFLFFNTLIQSLSLSFFVFGMGLLLCLYMLICFAICMSMNGFWSFWDWTCMLGNIKKKKKKKKCMEDTRMKWTEQSPAFWGSIEAILNNWLAHDTINIVCVWHDSIKVCDLTHKTCSYLSPHGSSLPSLKNKTKPKKKKKVLF